MKITFPHFGDLYIAARLFFCEIGVETVIPSLNSAKRLEEGAKYAPEEICLPFKLMMANLMECHKKGADTAIMFATMGPCRLGEYAELLKSILDANGFCFNWIVIDTPNDIGMKELFRRIRLIVSERTVSRAKMVRAAAGIYKMIKGLENLEKYAYKFAAYEQNRGAHKNMLRAVKSELEAATGIREALDTIKAADYKMRQIPKDKNRDAVQIVLTGEIYSLIEPFASHYLEERLMDLGVSFIKRMYISWWLDKAALNPFYLKYMNKKKNKYLYCNIGGYAKETVEDGLLGKRKRFDGVIQIFPAGCMPEIVSKAVFVRMTEDIELKVLTLIFDEIDGEAGYITRLEAFIDMLKLQKNKSKRERQLNVLSWN